MADLLFWLYLSNSVLLIDHEIESASPLSFICVFSKNTETSSIRQFKNSYW